MPADVTSLRRKVESGEVLTEQELRALDADGGFEARVVRAQALINADQDGEALRVLDALSRERPRDPEVLLARTRALSGLQRYADAEQSARVLLTVNEGDPEALKLLAIVAMRRGEHARAREYVRQVLERDPLDDEARLLRAELDGGPPVNAPSSDADDAGLTRPDHLPPSAEDPAPPPVKTGAQPLDGAARPSETSIASLEEFRRALRLELRNRRIPYDVRETEVVIAIGPRGAPPVRAALEPLKRTHLADGITVAEAARRACDELLRSGGMPLTAEALLAAVWPVLRPPAFEARASGSAHTPGPAGLLVYFVLPDPEFVRHVPDKVVESLQVGAAALAAAAWRNLERSVAPLLSVSLRDGELVPPSPTSRVWAVATGDGHDSARLLTSAQREAIQKSVGEGPWRVGLGRRELALICRESDAEAVMELESARDAADGIPGRFRLTATLEPVA